MVCSITDHLLLSPGPGRGLLSQGTHYGTEQGREADHTWTGGQAVCWRPARDKRSTWGEGHHRWGCQECVWGVPASLPHKSPNPHMPACRHMPSLSPPSAPWTPSVGSMLSSRASGGSRGSSVLTHAMLLFPWSFSDLFLLHQMLQAKTNPRVTCKTLAGRCWEVCGSQGTRGSDRNTSHNSSVPERSCTL